MRADVLVLENGWFDASLQADGTFHIRDVPASGKVTLTVWEPNGKRISVDVKGCTAKTVVPAITIEEQPPPPKIDVGY